VVVGVLILRYRLDALSLKEKRAVIRSLTDRVRARFNAAVAEVADLDDPRTATVAVVCVSNAAAHVDAQLQRIAAAVASWNVEAELVSVETESFPW